MTAMILVLEVRRCTRTRNVTTGAFLAEETLICQTDGCRSREDHVLTLKDVIDAQASGDMNKTFLSIRSAAGHMGMIADLLAAAIVKQFPDRFASR